MGMILPGHTRIGSTMVGVRRLTEGVAIRRTNGNRMLGTAPYVLPLALLTASLTLDLDLTQANATFTDLITFSRASSATYFNSSGVMVTASSGDPRFDHAPGTGAVRGLLMEPAATNLLLYSNTLTNGVWGTVQMTVTAGQATGPDGTASLARLLASSAGGSDLVMLSQNLTVATSTSHTISVYARKGTVNFLALRALSFTTPANGSVWFNLDTGVVGTQQTGLTGAIEDCGGGLYRCSITFTTDASDTTGTLYICACSADGSLLCPRDGVSSIFVGYAQCEAASSASSYIATSGSQVTRVADAASITGSDFSGFYNAATGTWVYEYRPIAASGTPLTISDGTANEAFTSSAGSASHWKVVDGGATQADIDGGSITAGAVNKLALAFAANDFGVSIGGAAAVTDGAGSLPTVDRVVLGTGHHHRRLRFYSLRVADDVLATLSA